MKAANSAVRGGTRRFTSVPFGQAPHGVAGAKKRSVAIFFGAAQSPVALVAADATGIALGLTVTGTLAPVGVVYLIVVISFLAATGSYRPRLAPKLLTELPALLGELTVPIVAISLVHVGGSHQLFRATPAVVGLTVVLRGLAYRLQRLARQHQSVRQPTLIVGAGTLGCQLAEVLQNHPEYGMIPVGFVDGFDNRVGPVPVLGDVDRFAEIVEAVGAKRVIIAFGSNREAALVEVLRAAQHIDVEVHVLPRLFELGVSSHTHDVDDVWGFPLQRTMRAALRSPAWRTKRVVDIATSSIALILAAPVLLVAAVAVFLEHQGPVLFRQQRIGQRGTVVNVLKFRSMPVNSDSDTTWSVTRDQRMTRVGRFLRKSNIDELPQMFNVLKGDMSLIGPRPERPHFADQFNTEISRYRDRLRVPVGLTGWAQVHGLRGDTSIEARARFDNYYIEHWSLWLDFVIIVRTVTHVLGGLLVRTAAVPHPVLEAPSRLRVAGLEAACPSEVNPRPLDICPLQSGPIETFAS